LYLLNNIIAREEFVVKTDAGIVLMVLKAIKKSSDLILVTS